MNKNLKMAIFIAPILIILGYIASDFYINNDANTKKIFSLSTEGKCEIFIKKCILRSGDFKINLFDKAGKTTINSTFPLNSVELFIVDNQNTMTQYNMTKVQTNYYWNANTPLRVNNETSKQPQTIRLIIKIKGSAYIAELKVL